MSKLRAKMRVQKSARSLLFAVIMCKSNQSIILLSSRIHSVANRDNLKCLRYGRSMLWMVSNTINYCVGK